MDESLDDDAPDVAPAVAEPLPEVLDDPVPELVWVWAEAFVVALEAPSRQARIPPSESIAATLTAVAATRARAARGGLRRGPSNVVMWRMYGWRLRDP